MIHPAEGARAPVWMTSVRDQHILQDCVHDLHHMAMYRDGDQIARAIVILPEFGEPLIFLVH
jgi:hypothetical protein